MIAGGNHTLIPNLPPVSCDYDPALAGGRLPPLPSQIPQPPPSLRTSPVPPGSHRTHASLVQREVAARRVAGGIAAPEMNFVSNIQIAPCRGRYFLVRQERKPKNRPGEALQMWSILQRQSSIPITPTPKRPPLGTPPAAARQLNAQRSGFIVGECCRAQRILNLK